MEILSLLVLQTIKHRHLTSLRELTLLKVRDYGCRRKGMFGRFLRESQGLRRNSYSLTARLLTQGDLFHLETKTSQLQEISERE